MGKHHPIPSKPCEENENPVLDREHLASMLHQDGALANALGGFEERPEQITMLQEVTEAFNHKRVLVVEAGTGVGKSLAYGLPAAAFSLVTGERVVISTATINLQEQLIQKDLPLVEKSLGKPLLAELVKGRSNYLCRRRWAERNRQIALLEENLGWEIVPTLTEWIDSTADGSRSDLRSPIPDSLWEEICSDADACLGARCPFRPECFFAQARKRADRSLILVVNHHLLFADLALRREREDWSKRVVLPSFSHVILDEAHELEDTASGFFGIQLSLGGVLRNLARLMAPRRKSAGLLLQVAAETAAIGGALARGKSEFLAGESLHSVAPLIKATRKEYESAFELLSGLAADLVGTPVKAAARVRLKGENHRNPAWVAVQESFVHAATSLKHLAESLCLLLERLTQFQEEDSKAIEARACALRLGKIADQTRQLVSEESAGFVRWVEVGGRTRQKVSLASAPLSVAQMLNQTLFEPMSAVVLTSATMSVSGHFDFFCERMGIDLQPPDRVRTLLLKSPFDFVSQARLVVPTDVPSPQDPMFEQLLPEAVFQTVAASGGRALVLFTAWGLMNRTFEMVHERLESMGIEVLCQGDAPRDRLLTRFRQDETSVLFGTDSFWQGVDVVGGALRNVVITRLPFDVPNDPLIQARMEALESLGKSSFQEMMLPRAILKLKQGFGRLIRSRSDWGSVVILDQRLGSRSYGKQFLQSLPLTTATSGPLKEVCQELSLFFQDHGNEASWRVVPLD